MPEGPITSAADLLAQTAVVGVVEGAARKLEPKPHAETAQEMVMSIIIAFAMAFVFRGFVIEAFVIPTGSMGPTLLGQHMRFQDPDSGTNWPVSTWRGSAVTPDPIQKNIQVHDPMSGSLHEVLSTPTLSGDRILVLKYLYAVFEPHRFDVVVFKNPAQGVVRDNAPGPADNYIKRLIGLPGEHIALIDGDVFVRPASEADRTKGSTPAINPATYWQQPGWKIARKGLVEQRALWQPVFDSSFAPMPVSTAFMSPWIGVAPAGAGSGESGGAGGGGAGWSFTNPRVYEYTGSQPTTLAWDQSRTRYADRFAQAKWQINDRYAYDELPPEYMSRSMHFPVSDLRMRAGVEAMGDALSVSASMRVRRNEFVVEITGGTVTLRAKQPGEPEAGGVKTWTTLGSAAITPLKKGEVRNIEFWHSDQSLRVFIDDHQVIGPVNLDWTPSERILLSTGQSLEALVARQVELRGVNGANVLAQPALYAAPQVSWTFSGPVRLFRVGLDRDIYYQPGNAAMLNNEPSLGTSPFQPLILRNDQFFCCGDNSPQSHDGRLWGYPEAWVEREFGRYPGVVPRDLLLGRAFFVYWPSLIKGKGPFPVPDFGRMRMIW